MEAEKQPPQMVCRGIRGATTVPGNDRESILAGTRELLTEIASANDLNPEDLTSIFFTMTPDLNAEYPALAARQLGWVEVPLLCSQEIAKPAALPRTVRVLLHWNTTAAQHEICHMYINGAEVLRPDQAAKFATAGGGVR